MRKENFEQVEKLSFDEMAEIRGGGFWDCALTTIGGMQTLNGFAYAMVFGGPFAWGTAIVGGVVTIGTIISNPGVCDNLRG